MSKVFKRLMHHQVSEYIDKHLSPLLCGYRKGFNTQTALLSLFEKWKSALDKKGIAGAVLMDLSKAFFLSFFFLEFLITGHLFEHLWLNVEETQVWGKNQVKLHGITSENELKFGDHIAKIYCKANS